ncbi:MAG: hypothetical protein HY748_12865 [Elusimicrobia bacterium]|nr:hypothetical protein [Elusimicrobiota bacterium]
MDAIEAEIALCANLSDDELWAALPRLAGGEREELARFLIHLGETERRDLHLRHAYSGLFNYLVTLGFSEWEARARAVAARSSAKFPSILTLLASGRLHLYAVVLLSPYLTSDNHESLLGKACRRTTRELQALIAGMDPGSSRRDVIRVVSAPVTASDAPESLTDSEGAVEPGGQPGGAESLFPELEAHPDPAGRAGPSNADSARLRFSFDGPAELETLLRRARDLLRHKYPYGAMGHIVYDALQALLNRIDPERRIQRRIQRDLARARRRGGG